MKAFKHINFDQRKIITSQLSKGSKLKVIAGLLDLDPTAVSKEIRRNRFVSSRGNPSVTQVCKLCRKFPFVCNNCSKRYQVCPFQQYRYEASRADTNAKEKLVYSRVGINMTEDEFKLLDEVIKEGVHNKESIYHIIKSHPELNISVSNGYKLIHDGILTTKKGDLPYACKYKKRKDNKKYNYSNNRIDRSNRTYLDYLAFKRQNPSLFVAQLDFLGTIKTDYKHILTLTIPEIHFTLIDIIENPNSEKVNEFFNDLEDKLGVADFTYIFGGILGD